MVDSRSGQPPDPVLVRLSEWATEGGLSKEAVARALGLSRPTVAGWLVALEAYQSGTEAPPSAREFNFAKQRPEVQAVLAERLGKPIPQLLAESTAGRALDDEDDVWAGLVRDSELWRSAEAMLGDLALGGLGRSSSLESSGPLWQRVSAVVEADPDVAAVSSVAVPRGRFTRLVWQYQIVVSAKPAPPEVEESAYVKEVRDRIEENLDKARLTCRWEHGVQRPLVDVQVQGRRLLLIGSLICPVISGSLPPSRGLLLPPGPLSAGADVPRLGVVVSGPFGGSGPIAGQLAGALGVGHVRDSEAIRAIRLAQAEMRGFRGERSAYLSNEASKDAGFMLHQVLYLLQQGDMPGAWLLSMETKILSDYSALLRAVAELDGIVVVVRSGPEWRRMAAWRMATAALNAKKLDDDPGGSFADVSTDWFAVAGGEVGDHGPVIEKQVAKAAEVLATLEGWERVADELLAKRAERPTIVVTLDEVPDHGECLTVEDGRFRRARMDEVGPGAVIFPDSVDGVADCWTDAAIDTLKGLLELGGHRPEALDSIVERLADGPVRSALEERSG